MRFYIIFSFCVLLIGCKSKTNTDTPKPVLAGFNLIPVTASGIAFKNEVQSSNAFNFLNYSYIYNGGGVAVGDINNDGLEDIYFTSNQNANKLYLNKGGLKFEDVTDSAGLTDAQGWSTGVSMIDINNDGFLDIYVCKSGKLRPAQRANKLFLNNQNGSFSEVAKQWGIADTGFSTQAYFLDYDKDGDLDMYLVNHRPDFGNLRSTSTILQEASDQLYRNEGDHFSNVSVAANIQNKAWGLSAAIADFNNDSWPDIYVSNDFNEPDFLYINNQKGGFTDEVLGYMDHISLNSMGSDVSDFDNDGLLDLMVLDMSAEDHVRSKSNMSAMNTKAFEEAVRQGKHHQYMYNMLQWNRGGTNFSEIAQLAGVAKTDWSWAPLFADFDNDGFKDIMVTNGIKKDVGNVDFRNTLQQKIKQKVQLHLGSVLEMVPSEPIPNYIFKNNGDLSFSKQTWGFNKPSFSNGAAYADFDNDGDLDAVINNLEDTAFLYQNVTNQNYLQIKIIGDVNNRQGIGTRIALYTTKGKQIQEVYANRGFQSSVSTIQQFGLADINMVDSVVVTWPNGSTTELNQIKANQRLSIAYKDAKIPSSKKIPSLGEPLLKRMEPESIGIRYRHTETPFNDYERQLLLPYKQSQHGPFMAVADVNGDGLEDFWAGGASGQAAALYLQNTAGTFSKLPQEAFNEDAPYEDMEAVFFDFDNDNDQDLYVVSGGNEFEAGSPRYQDRLYENNGHGVFLKTLNKLPNSRVSGQAVAISDIDKDGDLDIFLGGRQEPWLYPIAPKSVLLVNENGVFKEATAERILGNSAIGMITDALFSDYDADGDEDLLLVGEWMPITLLENDKGFFKTVEVKGLQNTRGLWFSAAAEDIDNDGDIDYFFGNIGLNTKFKVDDDHSFHIYGNDFDASGSFDVVLGNNYKDQLVPVRGKQCSSEQTPFIAQKFSSYQDFANASIEEIYGEDKLKQAVHYKADVLASVFAENIGNGSFSIKKLPNEVQLSPITHFNFYDFNADGIKEILTLGNLYPVEVETVRFDAAKGAVVSYSNSMFETFHHSGFFTEGDAKRLEILNQNTSTPYFMVSRNDAPLQVFQKRN